MAQNWTSRVTRKASAFGRVFRTSPQPQYHSDDADARRMRADLDAIRVRFTDHS